MKTIFCSLILLVVFFAVSTVNAQTDPPTALTEESSGLSRFIPCSGVDCNACHVVKLGNELIIWLFGIIFLLFAVLMMYAGFGLVTSGGNPAALQSAKSMFTNALIGLLIVMSAWLIVDTIMQALVGGGGGEDDAAAGELRNGWGPWAEIECKAQTPVTPVVGGGNNGGGNNGGGNNGGGGSCPIRPLTPITDPFALRMEAGETLIWENTDPRLRKCAEKKGGTITSAYRPQTYQAHLYEVWNKWCGQGLKDNTSSACSAVKADVGREMAKHGLSCALLVARNSSTHGQGTGVDISGAPQNNEHCLNWFRSRDRVHYTLSPSPGCVCN